MNKRQSRELLWRERMRIGREFLDWFPTKVSAASAGKELGITAQAVGEIERLAAYNLVMRMRSELRMP